MDRIGWHISNLIEDESTLVLHAGRMFDAIARNLKTKRELGITTNVISDWVIDLIEAGAISMERSRFRGGMVSTSYCYGTRRLYDYVDRNPIIEFHPLARMVNPFVIQRIPKLTSIMNVKKIDGHFPLGRQPLVRIRRQAELLNRRRFFTPGQSHRGPAVRGSGRAEQHRHPSRG